MQARHHCRLKQLLLWSSSGTTPAPLFLAATLSLSLLRGAHLQILAALHGFLQGMQGGGLRQQDFHSLIRGFSQLQAILGLSNGGSSGPYKVLSTTIISPLPAQIIKSGMGLQLQCLACRLVIRLLRCIAVRLHVICKCCHVGT